MTCAKTQISLRICAVWSEFSLIAGAFYSLRAIQSITKTSLFKYTENFTSKKWKFSDKKLWYFFILLLKT